MKIPIYQVDAFTSEVFKGNPAAVCPLKEWLPDEVMQKIAQENNLSETAFFIKKNDSFDIRWFTPISELDLACLLYTSDAADEEDSVDLGGRRIIK